MSAVKRPKYTFFWKDHTFTLTKYDNEEPYTCADRWDLDYNDGDGPTEEEFIQVVRRNRGYVEDPNRYGAKDRTYFAGWAIEVDRVFEAEENEFGVVSP